MTLTKPIISIENVVASANIKQDIILTDVKKKFPDTEYRPEKFPGLVFRLTSPKTVILVFRTGKMVCTGAKSANRAHTAVHNVVRIMKEGGININHEPEVTIQNIVASASLGGAVDLEEAARRLPRSIYEPEQFPGVIHRMIDPKTVILLFSSGKLVCTGAKEEGEVFRAISLLHSALEEDCLMIYE